MESPAFDQLLITVTEVEVQGVMSGENGWLVIGANNKILEILPAADTAPVGYLTIRGKRLTGW